MNTITEHIPKKISELYDFFTNNGVPLYKCAVNFTVSTNKSKHRLEKPYYMVINFDKDGNEFTYLCGTIRTINGLQPLKLAFKMEGNEDQYFTCKEKTPFGYEITRLACYVDRLGYFDNTSIKKTSLYCEKVEFISLPHYENREENK